MEKKPDVVALEEDLAKFELEVREIASQRPGLEEALQTLQEAAMVALECYKEEKAKAERSLSDGLNMGDRLQEIARETAKAQKTIGQYERKRKDAASTALAVEKNITETRLRFEEAREMAEGKGPRPEGGPRDPTEVLKEVNLLKDTIKQQARVNEPLDVVCKEMKEVSI